MLVACLRAQYARSSDQTCLGFGIGVAVRGVEAAGEATEDFEVWFAVCRVENGLGLVSLLAGCMYPHVNP